MDERKTILDYSPETYERVRQALPHVATVLGEWMEQVTVLTRILTRFFCRVMVARSGGGARPGFWF